MQRLKAISVELFAAIVILALLTITITTLFVLGYAGNISYNVAKDINDSVNNYIG